MANITQGQDLMFFIKTGTTSGSTGIVSIAYATSCSIDIAAETTEVSTKDNVGSWASAAVKKLSWSGSSDHLYADSQANGYDLMYKYMIAKQPIEIYFGVKTNAALTADSWTRDAKGYKGKALITSLSCQAPNEDNASYTVQFTGVGSLDAVTA